MATKTERRHYIKKENNRKYNTNHNKKLNIFCKEDCKNCPYKKCCDK